MARPRPEPLPSSLVVKNGSAARDSIRTSMPQPVSRTDSTTERVGAGVGEVSLAGVSVGNASSRTTM